MFTHGSSCLQGPVTRIRGWWCFADLELRTVPTEPSDPETPALTTPHEHGPAPEMAIRTDLVERVRREIAAGTYETPAKWEIALDRLLQCLETHD